MTEANNSGEKPSSGPSKLEAFQAALDRFEADLNLPPLKTGLETEVTKLLELDRVSLRGMSEEECFESCVLLASFATHLQRACNHSRATLKWCETNIRSIIAEVVGKVPGWAYEERRPLAIKQNASATRLEALRVQYQARLDTIEYLSTRVEKQAEFLADLGHTKRKKTYGQST